MRDHAAEPIGAGERVEALDVLRGFAVLGILLVNVRLFFSPIYLSLSGVEWFDGAGQRRVAELVVLFAENKFYTLFSLLFGAGLAIQMRRAEARGAAATGLVARRLGWLLAIGVAHAGLLWFGDILVLYALTGWLVLPFRRCNDRTLAIWIVALLALPLLLHGALLGLFEIASYLPGQATGVDESLARSAAERLRLLKQAREIYANGGFVEIFAVRAGETATLYSYSLFYMPHVLALFLIGFRFARGGFPDPRVLLPAIRRWIPSLLAAGLTLNLFVALTAHRVDPATPSAFGLLGQLASTLGAPALCLFYAGGIVLLLERPRGRAVLGRLAPVGRMALTNYLMHSAICTTLAYGYGFGLYGRISPGWGLVLACGIFALQIPFSAVWLATFRFGPLEWLWRSLTYGKLQPILSK